MDNLIKFNEQFPNSSYREINPQVKEGTLQEYQDSKRPINNTILDFNEVSKTKNRIGWIVPKEYIVVDVDNRKDASAVFNILKARGVKFSYMTGKHGGHFIFKNSKGYNQGVCFNTPIGIKIDTRCLEKGYIILPYHDTDRTWGNISSDVDEIPFFLIPVDKKKLKIDVDFVTLGEHDGRNQELFKHFLNLKDYVDELSIEDKVSCIRIINDFVLKDKIDDRELAATVLREELINRESKGRQNKKESLEEVACRIIADKQIITCNDNTYIYEGRFYKRLDEREIERMIHDDYSKSLEERHRKEIIKFIKIKTFVRPDEVNKNWNEIVVRNGILNISTMKLYPHTPLSYNTIYIDFNYNDGVPYSSIIDTFLNTISGKDPEKKQLFLEMIGYCFVQRNVLQKFFICFGQGQTGKSTFLNLVGNLLGRENSAYLDLEALDKDFMVSELFGKLVNIGDDINFKGVKNTGLLKKLVSGEEVMAREIYKSPFSFKNFAKLIFCTNKMPTISDKTSGFYRRLIILDMNNKIEKPDRFFLDKLTDQDYEYLLYKSIQAIRETIKRGAFTECRSSEVNLDRFKTDQSSALTFIEDMNIEKKDLELRSARELYEEYKSYCKDSGYVAMNRRNFQNEICEEFRLRMVCTTKNGVNQQWRFKS